MKIAEMYRISGGTDYRHTCYECQNCRKEGKQYICRLYQEHGGKGTWKPSYIACRYYNLPRLPEKETKAEEAAGEQGGWRARVTRTFLGGER